MEFSDKFYENEDTPSLPK